MKPKMIKKTKYFNHLKNALDEYDQGFLVNADNVGSKQMQEIRMMTRGDSYVLGFICGERNSVSSASSEDDVTNAANAQTRVRLEGC